jgi:uncharacterized protein (UPF0335 family)
MKTTTNTETTSKVVKASSDLVAKVQQLTEVRSEIARLEKLKEALSAEIREAFGEGETLVHRNIEVARLSFRSREITNETLLKTEFVEAYEATRKVITYPVIVSLYKEQTN